MHKIALYFCLFIGKNKLKRPSTYIIFICSIQRDHLKKLMQNLIKIHTKPHQIARVF